MQCISSQHHYDLNSKKNVRGEHITQSTCRIKSLLPAFGALKERDDEDEEQEAKIEEREEVALDKKMYLSAIAF